jgi:serine protease Do
VDSRLVRYIALAVVFVLAGTALGLWITVRESGPEGGPAVGAAPADSGSGNAPASPTGALDESRRTAIVRAAETVGPATVSISVTQTQVVRQSPFPADAFFERFFRGSYPDRTYERKYESYGSGVIIDADGYVITNDHVVRGADEVKVTLTDGREFSGRVLGGDPRYDIAVVKVQGERLPVAKFGDSDDLMIGEWAIAIGNPFGYLLNDRQPTVTAGVVSALHRDVLAEPQTGAVYKDMIQTDAAINPGNSGGPLVNGRGEVIGINSFIFSSSGGSEGMGFAIPVNAAREIINELIQYGRVRDVWVGIGVQDLAPSRGQASAQPPAPGALVSFVEPGSPAERAGVRVGDLIISVQGEAVANVREARRAIFGARVGDVVSLTILRNGSRRVHDLKLEEAPR